MYKSLPYIIDVEASGFGPQSYPIEVGVVLGGEKRYCRLIKPAAHWTYWCPEAEIQHQISRQLLEEKGSELHQVAVELNQLLADKIVYSDGWVVDQPWMIELFATAGVAMEFRISPLEMILSEPQMGVWSEAKLAVQKRLQLNRHRASNDALVIQQTYQLSQRLVDQAS